MRKLASLVNVYSKPMNPDPSPDDKGIGDKVIGFTSFSSPKKRSVGASFGYDGFAKIVNKKKRSQSANVGKEDDTALNSQVTKTITEKADYTEQAPMRRFRNPVEKAPVHSGQGMPSQSGHRVDIQSGQRATAQSGQRAPAQSGQRAPAQSEKRISTQSGQRATAQSGQRAHAQSGQRAPAQSEKCLSTQSEQRAPAQSEQPTPAQSGQQVRACSDQGTRQKIQAHTGQSFPSQSQSRLDKLPIRVPSMSGLHSSPTQSRQHTSQSGQTTPNESLSRQHTPESQSRQRTSGAQSEPFEYTPAPSHPSTLNLSSTAANDNLCWNIGSTQRDGRVRVEVIDEILEPSYECSARNRKIIYQQLEPTGYNWKSVSKATKSFYFEEFKKFFVWRQSDDIIYDGWLANARRKYSEVVCVARSNWEKNKEPHNRIGMNVYSSWVKFWETEEFQKKSLIQKCNRRSGVDGRPSTHTSGSASHRVVAARLKVQYKRNPTADQLFHETHIRHLKKKKHLIGEADENIMDDEDEEEIVWIDKKSQQTYETFVQLREQHEASGQPVDNNTLFLEAVGGPDKKRRVYGVGSSKRLFYQSNNKQPCTSSFTAEEENQRLKRQLIEMNDRMKAMENQLAMIVEATSARVQRSQSPANLDDQNDDD